MRRVEGLGDADFGAPLQSLVLEASSISLRSLWMGLANLFAAG